LALEACCSPSPVKWSIIHCYEYCYLPRGNTFRGLKDGRNLTDDQILGSFKACMKEQGNGTNAAFDGLLCRANTSAIDLSTAEFETDKYLTGGGITNSADVRPNDGRLIVLVFAMIAAFFLASLAIQ
jgi:hypothetical protein